MTVNSQSKGAVSRSPEEGLQLTKRGVPGGCIGRRTSCLASMMEPKAEGEGGGVLPFPEAEQTRMVPVGCLQPGKSCYNLGFIPWNPLSSPHERGSQLNFSWGPFTPPVICFMQDFFLLEYCKVELNEYSNSSLGLDSTPPTPAATARTFVKESNWAISSFSHGSDQIADKRQLQGSLFGPICFEEIWSFMGGKAWWQVAPGWWEYDAGMPYLFISEWNGK